MKQLNFNVNDICRVLDVKSINQATLYYFRKLESSQVQPEKRKIETHDDRCFNLAISALNALTSKGA